uniref:Myomesin 3 n=1 Tax=Pygocentrus nattereri TaxID=42514 RepID=A0A3B4BU57_PYGNA
MADDELHQRDKWTLFGNEAEKVEIEVIRNQHEVRKRVDRMKLRREVRKASAHLKFLEDLSMKAPDFPIPLRPHTVWEGMAVKLSCTIQGCPTPHVTWTALTSTTLTLKGVHKEHEGLYSVRLLGRDGIKEHSAFIYIKDGPAAVVGAPGSPLEVECSDVNRDYVFLSWKPPSADGAAQVQGYFIERSELGSLQWIRCNDVPQKLCYYPVMGLKENVMYQFRVCAVNQAGMGRPSKPTHPIFTSDPMEPSRTMVVKVDAGREIVIAKDQLESQIRVPFPPTDVHVCELTDSYAVISWTEPDPRGKETLTYFVERSIAGKESWHLASMDMMVRSTRFAAFDLQKGKAYCFRIRSINKYGISDPSEPSQPIRPQEYRWVPAAPHSVQAIPDTERSVLLLWKEPKDTEGILGYYLYCSEMGTSDWRTINNKPVSGTRFTVHGLRTNKEYVFRVKSVGRAGNSRYSEQSQPIRVKAAKVVPSAPSGVSLLCCSGSEMVIGWRAPTSHGGVPVQCYYLDQREKSQSVWKEVNVKPVRERVYTVSGLQQGHYYQFRVFASNVIGISKPSGPSEAFLCEQWTMPEPGCPYDLQLREVRRESLVLMWAEPLYRGQSQLTGYVVEISEGEESEDWTAISRLQAGQTYRLRVSAVNSAGVGRPSLPTEPVAAQTRPGTKDIEIGVDNDGFIFLSFEAPETEDEGQIKWSKNYTEAIDAGRAHLETKQNKSVLTFSAASEEDLGLYTAEMMDRPDISSSFSFTAEGMHHLIGLRSEGWQVDVSEQGAVRLWLQTEPLSSAAELRMILNDKEISSTPARKISFDRPNGLVEIVFDQLSKEDEGSYTAQLKDGRAKNQFTLVLVDEKFKQTLAKSQAKRRDWKRRAGPHFEEFLSWTVTEDCEMIMKCKVMVCTNIAERKMFTVLKLYLYTIIAFCSALKVTKKEAGVYRAVVSDSRGEDESVLELLDTGERLEGNMASAFKLALTVSLQLHYKHHIRYADYNVKVYFSPKSSFHNFLMCDREKRIDQEERTKPGSSMQKVWIEIFNPTENDKGKYTLEMFDGQETHKRTLDLSGQGTAVFLDLQSQRQSAVRNNVSSFCPDRAKVTKGLPDVVAIMEGKSLCLTCFAEGDPMPEMFWLKNDREISSTGQYHIAHDKNSSTITINSVTMEDSGNYSFFVRNTYGSQTAYVTVSVYKHGEKPHINPSWIRLVTPALKVSLA